MFEDTLPDTPSELILLAIDDLEKSENNPDHSIDMGIWYSKDHRSKKCMMCLAGAVMANEFDMDKYEIPADYLAFKYQIVPMDIGKDIVKTISLNGKKVQISLADKLGSLDSFRMGDVEYGLNVWGIWDFKDELGYTTGEVPSYRHDPEGFKKTMREMAKMLSEQGF